MKDVKDLTLEEMTYISTLITFMSATVYFIFKNRHNIMNFIKDWHHNYHLKGLAKHYKTKKEIEVLTQIQNTAISITSLESYNEDKIIVGFDDIKLEVDDNNKILKFRLFIYNFNILPINVNSIEFKINNSPFLKDVKPFCINKKFDKNINYYPDQYKLKREIIDSDNFLNAIELFIQSTYNKEYYYSQGHLNIELEMSLSYNGENKTKNQNLYPYVLLEDKSEVIKNIKIKK